MKTWIIIVSFILFLISIPSLAAEKSEYIIGVRAYQGVKLAKKMWQPTIDYLNEKLGDLNLNFRLMPIVDYNECEEYVAKEAVDFMISDPAFYVQCEYRYGVTRIATLEKKKNGLYVNKYGCIIISRADRSDINSINDLKNKSIMGVAPRGFAGWLMAVREFKSRSIDVNSFFSQITFAGGKGPPVVKAVKKGEVDAGVVRSGLLEMLETKDLIKKSDFKILDPIPHEFFPFETSTRLYPEFPFAKLAHIDPAIAQKVLIALLGIQENDRAAKAGHYARWSIPQEYSEVVALMRELNIEPFNEKVTILQFLRSNPLFTFSISAFIASLLCILLVTRVKDQTIRAEKQRLAVTLQSIGDGVITTDTAGKVILINKVAEELTGWPQEEAIGQPVVEVFNIINEKTGKSCENSVQKVIQSGKIVGLANHTAIIRKDGTQRTIEDSGAPILDRENRIIGVVLVFRDITNQVKMEEEILKIKKLESVGVLAGGIAHDFNNILTAILGNINLAGRYIDAENKAYSLLRDAEKASIRAKDLTQQLLTFSKGGDPVKKTTSIGNVITDSAIFVLRGSTVACRLDIPEDLWLVDIDTGQMSQVIQNIALNARHVMPEGGEINIVCTNISDITTETGLSLPGEKYIKITIEDHGGGISEKYLDKIFDPYFSTKQEGSGLGLAITHSIINKHDGHIFVQSQIGEGTTFTIYLPASDQQATHEPTKEAYKAKAGKTRILVMDDEQLVQDVAKQMLNHLGHEVLQAGDGKEAIAIFNEHRKSGKPIDVIIMDLTIPGGIGGKDAIEEILKINPEAKAVVSSGYSNDPVMADYQKYGFKAAIGKPFSLAELNETINSVLA